VIRTAPPAVKTLIALLLVFAYMFPGPPKHATAVSKVWMLEQVEANGVRLDDLTETALNELALVYESRPDLQGPFAPLGTINVRDLLGWVISQPDASAQSISKYLLEYRRIVAQWDDPGSM
jgi:hypothetical protein